MRRYLKKYLYFFKKNVITKDNIQIIRPIPHIGYSSIVVSDVYMMNFAGTTIMTSLKLFLFLQVFCRIFGEMDGLLFSVKGLLFRHTDQSCSGLWVIVKSACLSNCYHEEAYFSI